MRPTAGALRRVSLIPLIFFSFSSSSSEPGHQVFIDTMNMFDDTLSYKELIRNVLYVRFIASLTGTQTIVISDMEEYTVTGFCSGPR